LKVWYILREIMVGEFDFIGQGISILWLYRYKQEEESRLGLLGVEKVRVEAEMGGKLGTRRVM
jgi:hypothetical protein